MLYLDLHSHLVIKWFHEKPFNFIPPIAIGFQRRTSPAKEGSLPCWSAASGTVSRLPGLRMEIIMEIRGDLLVL